MKKIILLLLLIGIIVFGLAAGPALINYKGYFLIALESGTYQLSIFGMVFVLVTLFIVGWLTILLVKKLIDILAGSQDWLFGFSSRRKQKAFTQGLISLAEGNYLDARKSLDKIQNEDFDGINLLALAEAEVQLDNKSRARELWLTASNIEKTRLAANLCIIRDCIIENNCEQALTNINNLPEKQQNSVNVIKLWARCLEQTQKFSLLKDKLPKWKKPLGKEYDYWLLQAAKGEFAEIASKEGAHKLKEKWLELPRSARKEPGQIAAYAQQLIEQSMYEDAQSILVSNQKSGPVSVLFPLYRQLKNLQTNAAIKQLEGWLKSDDKNVELLSTLGQLALNMNDVLLAEKALTKAIKLDNNRRDVLLLAQIKEAQKDNIHALELYKKSILEQ
ncbi:heme biosynthesis HemY N-terminal domain-containing protein [Aliiglaciecola sp. LCG003]|uniref:heme biosynthesis HemY N-terminal domain-containing protein n=1 Tax=Aliiglaciecola sp. LCG003 TaxID=3053655 RepID=UPI0025730347|nr:heme biosynthesis HemY N-terminal domain-containing protein [Aliiglaciecola sp. LCG003]WJG09574.1 heme biosynthesis HemY N-terminal domain-containing protein [Aliiglaciecola sp. LCG003]